MNKRVALFFQKKSEVRFFGYATYAYFDTQPTATKNKNKEKDSQSTLFCVAPRVGVRDSQSTLFCVAPRVGVYVLNNCPFLLQAEHQRVLPEGYLSLGGILGGVSNQPLTCDHVRKAARTAHTAQILPHEF